MESRMNKLSSEEKRAITKLQLRLENSLSPALSSDPTLFYRFLRARDFNVDKAEEMLRNHIAWRKAFQVDTILDSFEPNEVFKYFSVVNIGYGKDGISLNYGSGGKMDIRDLVKVMKINDYMKHWIWLMEKLIELQKLTNNVQSDAFQLITIVNLDGFQFSNAVHKASSDFCVRLANLVQDNYPDRMKGIYIINAPLYFTILFSILRTVLASASIKKIHIYGYNGWKEDLLNVIDANVLPAFLGGNRTDSDGDPLCKSFIYHGGKNFSNHYLSDEDRYFKEAARVEKVVVPHNEKRRIATEISEADSLIQWEFQSKNKGIGFGLEYQSPSTNVIDLLPIQNIVTSDGTEKGCFKTQVPGTYLIVFDNSDSRWSSKEIHYCVTVNKPHKMEE